MCGGEPSHYVMAELFSSEVVWSPFIDVIYGAVVKVFVRVDFHGVQWVFGSVLWFGEVLWDGWWGSF